MKNTFQIHIENTIEFSSLQNFYHYLKTLSNISIITEKTITQLYPHIFHHIQNHNLILDIHEHQKTISTAEKIWTWLTQHQSTKQSTILIIGGGVLHDVSMFACSLFKRGLPCISIPTTLLSMTDAAIGGKNAVNFWHTKNILGTIHLPIKNMIIPEFLQTLSKSHLLSGWAEILKVGLIADATFYEHCLQHLKKTILPIPSIIQQAIELKLSIIQHDLHDQNNRQLLNYGHTIAHAIEAVYEEKQQYIPHGYAVAYGMLIENIIARKMNILPHPVSEMIHQHLTNLFHFPIHIQKQDIPLLLQKIQHDKKNTHSQIHFTLLENIGKAKMKVPVNATTIQTALGDFFNHF